MQRGRKGINMARNFRELEATMSPARRKKAKQKARAIMQQMLLAELRKLSGLTQAQMAKALGVRQPTLSKLENADDMQISTLRRLITALGGELRIIAKLPHGSIELPQFEEEEVLAGG
jgi:DNA-binding XRE family transcriptional regulator